MFSPSTGWTPQRLFIALSVYEEPGGLGVHSGWMGKLLTVHGLFSRPVPCFPIQPEWTPQTAPHRLTKLSFEMWQSLRMLFWVTAISDSLTQWTYRGASRTHLSSPGGTGVAQNLSSSEPQGTLQWNQVTGVSRGPVLLPKSTCRTLGHVLGHVLLQCPANCLREGCSLRVCGPCRSIDTHTDPVYPFSWPCTIEYFGFTGSVALC